MNVAVPFSPVDDAPIPGRSSGPDALTISSARYGVQTELQRRWQLRREELRPRIIECRPRGIPAEELEAHFQHMPPRYWADVELDEVCWALETIHRFLCGNAATSSGDTPVVVDWRACPSQRHTKLIVCTWDRAGLLARLAAYMSALRLNIIRAEVFTRADNIALDVFWLSQLGGERPPDCERVRQLEFLIQGGLSEPPRFASAWACESHKAQARENSIAPCVEFYDDDSAAHTIVTVDAAERLGLLHDILRALSDCGLNIVEALVDTVDGVAHDIFFVTDSTKRKVPSHDHRHMEEVVARSIA